MVVDSSALIAILLNEPEAPSFLRALIVADSCSISAANFFETSIVIQARRGDDGVRDLDGLMAKYQVEIVDFTASQAQIARRAYRRYGKGHHAARLNFGDCIAYALAKDTGEPLLFKGGDFDKTDITAAAV